MYLPEEIWKEIWQYDTRYREMYNIVEDLDRVFNGHMSRIIV